MYKVSDVHKLLIITTEICKAPTPRLKALNNYNVMHLMYVEMENVVSNLTIVVARCFTPSHPLRLYIRAIAA